MKVSVSWSIFTLIFLMSCSSVPTEKPFGVGDLTKDQREQLNRDALALASERLAAMVAQARESESSTKFLSGDLFLKANMALMEGDFATASVLFKHLVNLVPDDQFVLKKYAVSLIRMNDLETAREVLLKMYEKGGDERVGLILAGVHASLDEEQEARKVYVHILKKNPKNEDACIFLSKSHAIAKETEKAFSLLNGCASREPKNGMYHYYMGKMHVDQGHLTKALAAFQESHKRQPTLTQAVSAIGTIYEEKENLDAAIALYKRHLVTSPQDATILNRIVQGLFLKERYEEVIPYAETLSDLEPENLNLKVKLGILYTDAKKFPEALSVFRDLLKSAPGSDKILYYLGAINQEMKNYEESIEYFNQIGTDSGLYTDSSVQMANMLSTLAQGEQHEDGSTPKWKGAFLKHIDKKIGELKEYRVEFSVIKSGYFEATGQYREAMQAMELVKDEKSFSTQHKYYLANLYEKLKNFKDATSLIMGIIEKEPKNAQAWNFLGYSLLTRGEEMDKAFEYIQTALKLSPDDGYIRDSLGWYYYKKGDIKKALVELQLALKKVPDDIEILKHLAVVHRELKDYSKAKSYLEAALKLARYPADKQEILSGLELLETTRVPASGN